MGQLAPLQCGASLTAFLWAMERFRNTARCAEIGVVPCDRSEWRK
jgi:hypothetical protein